MPSRNTSVTATCSVCAAPLPPGRARRTCSDASAADTRTVSRARRSGVFHPIRSARAAGRSALRWRASGYQPATSRRGWWSWAGQTFPMVRRDDAGGSSSVGQQGARPGAPMSGLS